MAAIITNIDPTTLEIQNYSNPDINLIPLEEVSSQFDPFNNYVEYTIISTNGYFQVTDQNFLDYKIINDYSPTNTSLVYSVDINPENNLTSRGFSNGEYNVIYNFLNNELNSSTDNRSFFIKEISSDKTEIKLASNILSNIEIETAFNTFKSKLNNTPYFQDFYLNFGSNNLIIANNILLDNTKSQYEILINLYEVLPSQFKIKDTLWIVTQVADPLAFNIQFQPEVIIPVFSNPTLKGPNLDLPLKDRINNSTNYINYEELLSTGLTTSHQQILSYLQDKSISIGVDYSEFDNFVHFSSAKTRVENFYYKIQLIEQYNSDITTLYSVESSSISSSVSSLQSKIDSLITNFDGFEYYLYFDSGSITYPKGNSTPPYDLDYSLGIPTLTWLGSDNPQSPYYGGLILSASIYDENNQNYLINTIPDYLKDDPQNEPYRVFVDMIGQFYDNIWVYYKDVSNRYNGDNRLEFGISKDLVADALRSFGLKIYQNNFSTNDLYNAFTGFNNISGSLSGIGNVYITSSYITEGEFGYFVDDTTTISTGDELITNFISASQEALYEPTDDVNKEIYKRLYHNLPLLLKQKGTVAGLRNLINVYGIPDTILRISEFGGRDKDTSTYDYFQNQYNYSLLSSPSLNNTGYAVQTPWVLRQEWPTSSYNGASGSPVPETLQLRFKTADITATPNIPYSQSIFELSNDSNGSYPILTLTYTGSGYSTASYSYPNSGSAYSSEYQYAKLDFVPNPQSYPNESASVYLPFFDGSWWSVMVNWTSSDGFVLYAGNKLQYDGFDGNQIGFLASSSIVSSGHYWGDKQAEGMVFGPTASHSPYNIYTALSGSFQEIRYFSQPVNVNSFKDFVMNPNSIDYAGETDYADVLAFRSALGGELYYPLTSSIHPKITGSWVLTSSFQPNTNIFNINSSSNFTPNIENVFFNSPIAGLRNRVTDKIQIVNQELPQISLDYTQSGDTLSQYISIQQNYIVSGSETPDVNALEVAFSPTNEVDDDIISSLGYFNIGEYIGDPRQISSSNTSYPDLNALALDYFQKYYDRYDLYDYIRLIKFFDNSLFKMIKDFVPARTNLRSGIVVKQHILERNKYPQPQMIWEDVTYSGSIDTAFFSGSTGGTFNEFNNLYSSQINITTNVSQFDGALMWGDGGYSLTNSYVNIFNNLPSFSGSIEQGFISDNYLYSINSNTFTSLYNGLTNFYFIVVPDSVPLDISFRISSSINGYLNEYNFNLTSTGYFNIPLDITLGETVEFQVSGSGDIASFYAFAQQTNVSLQSWYETTLGPSGSAQLLHFDQSEFYNGELPGTEIEVTDGELNEANVFKYPSTLEIYYDPTLYLSNITPVEAFLDINTSPNQGQIYLWFDSGSTIYPPGVPGGIPFALGPG
jgi:hypothetical protein